ncbi:hypothetical protein E6H20_04005 [Candidatus Bathyarchaeota archaeon]|nr:MAG: hypothetical protein E6H20_04005 [Candidatus Bathyarchaeota archaeon]
MLTQFLNISGESIQKAATVIQSGGLVVYPTDTVYGLGCQVTGLEKMVGLRIPDRRDTLDLISKAGGSLLGTSANISGNLSLRTAEDAFKVFEGKVDIVLNGGITSTRPESTVVKQTRSGVQVLRQGAIGSKDLRKALPLNVELQE